MDRADHYRAADDLVWKARRSISDATEPGTVLKASARIGLLLQAAQVHATLAAVGRDVEDRVQRDAREAAAAVARAEELRGVGPAVVESPAYGTEPTDAARGHLRLDTAALRLRPFATIDLDIEPRQGPPERPDLGSPGCAYPGKGTPR